MEGNAPKPVKYTISRKVDAFFMSVQHAFSFAFRFFGEVTRPPFHFKEVVRQCHNIGYKSLPLISLTGFITGLVFTKQSRPSLADFGATSWLPSLVSIAIMRALAPLVTALICSGKAGSNIGAELGSMKVTEQIDAMEVSAINPYKFLVVTRVLAITLMLPLLTFYSAFVGLMGSFLDINAHEQTSFITFFENAFSTISFLDYFTSLVKALVFGFTIGIVSSYKGFHASKGTMGVGIAANSAVVTSMFLVFIEEITIVQISNFLRGS
jgi:phospholipid/cholesterol/gamma-HCH transport system permease protein